MKLNETEIKILKQLLSTAKHNYTRGFQCECGNVHDKEMRIHNAETENDFGAMICKNCGETRQWKDIKIKKISFDFKKIRNFKVIEQI